MSLRQAQEDITQRQKEQEYYLPKLKKKKKKKGYREMKTVALKQIRSS